ncbi:MAG: cheB3 [Bacteroidetes bacterium]|nr:cheB3 [Bacteroidota bacterium]
MSDGGKYDAIVIGVSAGGLKALRFLIPELPVGFQIPIVIVQHISAHSDGSWIHLLSKEGNRIIKEADEKEEIKKEVIYVAPPNYHLMIERDKTFALDIDEKVNYARPSIDVLFESAAEAYRDRLIGIILTGSGADGAKGLKRIKDRGGLTIAQDPAEAESASMPTAAIAATQVDHILSLRDIVDLLVEIENTHQ